MDILGRFLQEQTPIYNRYLNGDFVVGADNLNPKREIQQDNTQSITDLRLALYAKYKGIINAITTGDNTAAAPSDLGVPYINRTQVSTTVPLRDGMAPTSTPVPVTQDLYRMLKVINGFLGGVPITLDDLPFDICNDRVPPIEEATSSKPIMPGTSSSTSNGASSTAGLVGASNTGADNAASTGNNAASSDIKCVMVELQMLQAIFQIIAFIKHLFAIEQAALAYIYPFIEFAQMVAACFLNPAMIQQLAMSVVGQAMAAIIGFITDMISQWLGNLNLECLMSNVMAEVQNLLGSINGVGDLGSAVGSFVKFNAKGLSSAEILAGNAYQATQGNSKALFQALGIPTDQQTSAAKMNAGDLFNLAMKSGTVVSVNSVVGMAKGVYASTVGTAVGAIQNAAKGINTSVVDIQGSAKLIKDYFPGGQFSTF